MTGTPPGPLPVADPSEVGMDPDRLEVLRDRIDEQVAGGGSPTIVAVVARHGKIVFTHAAGDARPGGPPATVDSVFPIASQTKPMAAMLILALAERGVIGINEPAAFHLPELAAEHGDVLIHHLLTHTTGWHEDDHTAAREAKLAEAIASIPDGADPLTHILIWPGWEVPRRCEPGDRMQYCNFNYDLLGEIVRRVTGRSFDAALRHHVLDPVGMGDSAVIVPDDLAPRVIERPPGIPFAKDHADTSLAYDDPMWAASDSASSGGHASMPDLARFGQVVLDRGRVGDTRVVSDAAVEMMTTNRIPGIPAEVLFRERREASWGYGFSVTGWEAYRVFGGGLSPPNLLRHGGSGVSCLWIDPTTDVVCAYAEVVTALDELGMVTSWIGHRVEALFTSAVID